MLWFMRTISLVVLKFALILPCSCAIVATQSPQVDHSTWMEENFKIAGTVVSSLTGTPLNKTRISLTDTTNRENTISVLTAEDGRFAFSSLKRGKYSLAGVKSGFLPAGYEQHEEFSTAIVTGAEFNTENLVLRLTPLAMITGKVFDETGAPVRKAQVRLFIDNQQGGRRRTVPIDAQSTDDEGYYEFAGLFPANYFFSVSANPWYAVPSFSSAGNGYASPPSVPSSLDVAYPTTYNNGATDSQGASPISVQGGDHLQVDVHLSPVQDEQQGMNMPAFEKRVFDSAEYVPVQGQQISPGIYELSGVPAGKYTVRFTDPKGQAQQSSEMNLLKEGQELDVTHGEPGATFKMSMKMPLREPPSQQVNIALQDSHQQIVAFKPIDAAGEVEFQDLPSGKYGILAFSLSRRYAVARTISGGIETTGHDIIAVPGSSVAVTVILALGVVNIEGFVKRGDNPSSGVMVALVPHDPQSHLEMFRRDQSDSDGSFVLSAVTPGHYTLIAVEDAWGFQWQQPDVLNRYLQHGQKIIIGELMTRTVHLPEPLQVQPR